MQLIRIFPFASDENNTETTGCHLRLGLLIMLHKISNNTKRYVLKRFLANSKRLNERQPKGLQTRVLVLTKPCILGKNEIDVTVKRKKRIKNYSENKVKKL